MKPPLPLIKILSRTGCGIALLSALIATPSWAAPPETAAPVADATPSEASPGAGSAAFSAAETLLATLSETERDALLFAIDDETQRANWSNLPVRMAPRAGLRLGDLSEKQKAAVTGLLAALLSEEGLEKIQGIVASDEDLKIQGGRSAAMFGADEFFLSILGTPSKTEPWIVQFGGHHLGLNAIVKGDAGVLTPSLIAVQPARFSLGGKTVRPMGDEVDKALALMQSLDESQQAAATLGSEFRDLVLGVGHDGETLSPEGVKVSTFDDAQKAKLLDLIGEWAGILHAGAAAARMEEISAGLDETWFAWSGPVAAGEAAYFRIQGPKLHIELAPQNLGGDPTNHIHSIYRDPTNDYGTRFFAETEDQ